MAKINNIRFDIDNTGPLPAIVVNCGNLPAHIKVKDATLTAVVQEVAEQGPITVNFKSTLVATPKWATNIEKLSSLAAEDKIVLHIADELQFAIENRLSSFILEFTQSENHASTLSLCDVSQRAYGYLNVEHSSKAEYIKNSQSYDINLGSAGNAAIRITTGQMDVVHTDTSTENSVLPVTVAHVYNSTGTILPGARFKNYYGKGWKLNLEQYLIKQNLPASDAPGDKEHEFKYIDEAGKEQVIVEKYYYTDGGEKVFVDRKDLTINFEGELEYESKAVKTKLEAPSGLNLVTSKADIKGVNLADTEPEELSEIRDRLKQLNYALQQMNISANQNKEQLCYLALAKATLIEQDRIQRESLQANKQDLSFQIDDRKLNYAYNKQNVYNMENVDYAKQFIKDVSEKFDNTNVQNVINRALGEQIDAPTVVINGETKTLTELDIEFVLSFFRNKRNLEYSWGSEDIAKLNWDTGMTELPKNVDGNDITCSMMRQLVNANKNIEFFSNKLELNAIESILEGEFTQSLADELKRTLNNLFVHFGYNSENGQKLTYGIKDILSLDTQIRALKQNYELYKSQMLDYQEQIIKLTQQKNEYESQLPAYYLYSEDIVYGFAPTHDPDVFRLNYIGDNYENAITINFAPGNYVPGEFIEDENGKLNYDGGDYINVENKIENVIDSNDNIITFEYDADHLLCITDAKERKITFDYDIANDRLTQITYNDGSSSRYFYIGDNLVGALGSGGLGASFEYAANKIKRVSNISILEKIQDGKAYFKEQQITADNLANFKTDDKCVFFKYNNFKSTTVSRLITRDGSTTTQKSLTYIFDNAGRVRTVYENEFNEFSPSHKNVAMQTYDYIQDNVGVSVRPLLNSYDYMDDTCFNDDTVVDVPFNYFGDDLICGDDIYLETYPVHVSFHKLEESNGFNRGALLMSDANVAKLNQERPLKLVLSGWAKADSAFMPDPDKTTSAADVDISEYPAYVQNRKFELRAEITYQDNTVITYSKCFDYMNTGWQYCAVPVTVDPVQTIVSIVCTIDYSNNTGDIFFTDFALQEAEMETSSYLSDGRISGSQDSRTLQFKNYSYDKNDRLSSITYKMGNLFAEYKDEYFYNKNGKLFKTIDYKGIVTEKVFDQNGRELKTMTYHKDNPAEILFSQQKLSEKGEVLADYNELGEEVNTYEYINCTGEISVISDAQGNKTAYGYDTKTGALLQMTSDVDGTSNTNTYAYTLDYLTKVTHNDFDVDYDYDARGRVSKIKIANTDYMTFDYDDLTNSSTVTYADGQSFTTMTDDDGKVIETSYKPNPTAEESVISQNIYDTHGNLIETVDKTGNTDCKTKQTLDKYGNIVLTSSDRHGLVVEKTNQFDENNCSTKIDYIINQITQTTEIITNEDGTESTQNITTTTPIAQQVYEYTYTKTPNPELTSIKMPFVNTQFITNDELGRVKNIKTGRDSRSFYYLKNGNCASNLVSSIWYGEKDEYKDNLKYSYDEKGNITQVKENGSLVARYFYDGLSRLIREDNKSFGKTTTWEYDGGGNILNRREYTYTLSQDLSEKDYIPYRYTYLGKGLRDQLQSYNGESFVYDAIGNPTTYRNKTLTWSKGRQLDTFTDIASYTYTASGVRTAKTVNIPFTQEDGTIVTKPVQTKYFLDGTKIIMQQETVEGETPSEVVISYFYGVDGIAGFNIKYGNENDTYHYKKNHEGDIIGIYDYYGNLVVKYSYDAWGKHIIKFKNTLGEFVDYNPENVYNTSIETNLFIAIKNPFRYRSYYFDQETNLYYLNSRYYDPELGRFITIDEVSVLDVSNIAVNGINLYAYCLNNPVNEVDENGYFLLWLFLAAIIGGAAISAGVSVVTQGLENGWGNINWGRVGFAGLIGGLSGLLMASGIGAFGMAAWGGALGFASSFGDQLLAGTGINQIDWLGVGLSTLLGALPGVMGRAGATNEAVFKNILKKSVDYKKALGSFMNVRRKIINKSYATTVGAKIALSRVSNKLLRIEDTLFLTSSWRNLILKMVTKIITSGIKIWTVSR